MIVRAIAWVLNRIALGLKRLAIWRMRQVCKRRSRNF